MKLPSDESKYLSSWKYVELAKYVPSLKKVIRIKKNDKPFIVDIRDVESFRIDNDNIGLYTSIWHYDKTDIDNSTRLSSLYFDIDSADFAESYADAINLYQYLIKYIPEDSVLVYFTGKKGFHIECEAIALGVNPSNNLPNIFRFIAQSLKEKLSLQNLDFSVYDSRRMWRLTGSRHQDTLLYKNIIPSEVLYSDKDSIINYCKTQASNTVKEQFFSAKANEWFRDFTYELEIDKERSKDFIGYFNKYGSSAFKSIDQKEKTFTPKRLVENCSAIKKLYDQAVENKFLEHEARLFLCSILSYTEDSIEFLHAILSNCDDYNIEKTNSHIKDWVKRRELGIGGRPYTCDRANSVGVGCGDCALDRKNKYVKIGEKYVETQELSSPSPIRFAYSSKDKGGEYGSNRKSR